MRFAKLLAMVLLILIVSGCATVSVRTDYDPEYDFSTFKTYRWATDEEMNPDDALVNRPLLRKRFVKSVDSVMMAKGFQKVDSGDADLVIVMHAGTKEKMRVDQMSDPGPVYYGGGYYRGWYSPWWGPYGGRTTVSYYTEGTLVIDMVSWKTKGMVWRGVGTKTVMGYKDHEKQQAAIDKAVAKILAEFPPT